MNRTSSLSSQPSSSSSSSSSSTKSTQFKHTFLWNNIIDNLKSSLLDDGHGTSENQQDITYSHKLRKQQSRFITSGMLLIKQNLFSSAGLTQNSSCLENICFTGAQCVDIVYSFLTRKDQVCNFERQVTREKVTKLCQSIMDSGVFEPVSRSCTRFDDTLLKFYRFKPEEKATNKRNSFDNKANTKGDDSKEAQLNLHEDCKGVDENASNKNLVGMAFNKCKMINKVNMTNTKLKRKVNSMKRSSTIQTLMPVEKLSENISTKDESSSGVKQNPCKSSLALKTIDNNTIEALNTQISKSKIGTKYTKYSSAQDLLLTQQITREVVVEKLLSLIELPVIEHLLEVDHFNDIEYQEHMDKIEKKSHSTIVDENQNVLVRKNSIESVLFAHNNDLFSSSHKSLRILNETYDLRITDNATEWKQTALECLEFLDCTKEANKMMQSQLKTSDKLNKISFLEELELYQLIKDFYLDQRRACFFDNSFQPLFAHILLFLRNSQYSKALETLNLGTLLMLKQFQAELKRLLKFLYITANFANAPRLDENKQNNSILLNHFSSCLINTKLLGFEESRLILNFMLNNFDHLFKLSKPIEESIAKRRLLMQKYGQEEALLEKLYCKRITKKELAENSKDQTTKALVDLINHIIDDPQISLKQKKLKLKAMQRIHPDIYDKHFSDLF